MAPHSYSNFKEEHPFLSIYRESLETFSAQVTVRIPNITCDVAIRRSTPGAGPFRLVTTHALRVPVHLSFQAAGTSAAQCPLTHILLVGNYAHPVHLGHLASQSLTFKELFYREQDSKLWTRRLLSTEFHGDGSLKAMVVELPIISFLDLDIDADAFDVLLHFMTLGRSNRFLRNLLQDQPETWSHLSGSRRQICLVRGSYPLGEHIELMHQYNEMLLQSVYQPPRRIRVVVGGGEVRDLPTTSASCRPTPEDSPLVSPREEELNWMERRFTKRRITLPYSRHSLTAQRIIEIYSLCRSLRLDANHPVWDMVNLGKGIIKDRMLLM